MKQIVISSLFLISFTFCASAQAILFANDITGVNPNTSDPYIIGQINNSNLLVSGIGRGTGIAGANGIDRYNADGWSMAGMDMDDYFYWTITPNSNSKINFSNFNFTYETGSHGPTQYALRSSLDGFSANISAGGIVNGNISISLSAGIFQGVTTPVTFRLYAWGATNVNGDFSVNDFAVMGTVSLILPVELTHFDAAKSGKTVAISFSTANELNNLYFGIEHSTNGVDFSEIGRVKGSGTDKQANHYEFRDENPAPGINFYRLRQVDFDGKLTYSNAVSVRIEDELAIRLSPVPVRDQLTVHMENKFKNDCNWQVLDYTGRVWQSGTAYADTSDFSVDVARLTSGAYFLRIVDGQSTTSKSFQK